MKLFCRFAIRLQSQPKPVMSATRIGVINITMRFNCSIHSRLIVHNNNTLTPVWVLTGRHTWPDCGVTLRKILGDRGGIRRLGRNILTFGGLLSIVSPFQQAWQPVDTQSQYGCENTVTASKKVDAPVPITRAFVSDNSTIAQTFDDWCVHWSNAQYLPSKMNNSFVAVCYWNVIQNLFSLDSWPQPLARHFSSSVKEGFQPSLNRLPILTILTNALTYIWPQSITPILCHVSWRSNLSVHTLNRWFINHHLGLTDQLVFRTSQWFNVCRRTLRIIPQYTVALLQSSLV